MERAAARRPTNSPVWASTAGAYLRLFLGHAQDWRWRRFMLPCRRRLVARWLCDGRGLHGGRRDVHGRHRRVRSGDAATAKSGGGFAPDRPISVISRPPQFSVTTRFAASFCCCCTAVCNERSMIGGGDGSLRVPHPAASPKESMGMEEEKGPAPASLSAVGGPARYPAAIVAARGPAGSSSQTRSSHV